MKKPAWLFIAVLLLGCKKGTQQQEDEIYSRHLQRKVKLTVINTPVPSDKNDFHLLLLNDGQEAGQLRVKQVVDSLYENGLILPLVVVAIHAGDRMQEFGVADHPDFEKRGSRAAYYERFIDNELYFYAKKNAGVRKFKSVTIAGFSLGGLSAFDFAWNHADKIDKVAVFSGSFWWRDKDAKDSTYREDENRIMYSTLRSSRKRPKLQYWFYCGGAEESSDRDKDGVTDVIDDTRDIIDLLTQKKNVGSESITYKEVTGGKHDWPDWSKVFPEFLVWAFGK